MQKKSITQNYIYNLLYQMFQLIVPLAVTPYIARVLGEDGSGSFAFTSSISHYFVLFASLGFNLYGQRTVASHQNDRKQQSIDFFEILAARSIPTLVSLLLYVIIISTNVFAERYSVLLIIQSLTILSVGIDVAFFFQGNEEFGRIVRRNIFIRAVGIACIFIFVKKSGDLWKYTLIQSLTTLGAAVTLWVYLPKRLQRVTITEVRPLRHLKASFILFMPTIATSIYTVMDKTLIGLITNLDAENGNYEYAERIVKMALTVITSLGAVVTPRNSAKYALGDLNGIRENIQMTLRYVFWLGTPMMFGCIAIAGNLIPWFLGESYTKASALMRVLSPIILVIGISNVFGLQLLIPCKRDKAYTAAVSAGAAINLVLNVVLIRRYQSFGAAAATVIAECVVTGIMAKFSSDIVDIRSVIRGSWLYLLSGSVMFLACFALSSCLAPSPLNTLMIITVGVVVYFSVLLLCRDVFTKTVVEKVLMRMRHKH